MSTACTLVLLVIVGSTVIACSESQDPIAPRTNANQANQTNPAKPAGQRDPKAKSSAVVDYQRQVVEGGKTSKPPAGAVPRDDVEYQDAGADLRLELVAEEIPVPTDVQWAPGDPERIFAVSQTGQVWIIRDGRPGETPFLDIGDRVKDRSEGLTSIAFHPDYQSNGYFYVQYYDNVDHSRIERYSVSDDPDVADPTSALTIFELEQPRENHNGGLVTFGPDGMLYFGLGDGGAQHDPNDHGQNLGDVFATILRVDVDSDSPYAIPPDNPFVDRPGARGEIWLYGLRNAWRFTFDRANGDLYIGDVGQDSSEEIDYVAAGTAAGQNFGWSIIEGSICHEPEVGCDTTGLTPPIHEYFHPSGCSISGGHVYRGKRIPSLVGHYVYGDVCSGFIRSFRVEDGVAVDHRDYTKALGRVQAPVSFTQDHDGELYVVSLGVKGKVYRISPSGPAAP